MTFSLAALDEATGSLGIVISSSSPAVAARCAHVRAGVGAACSQNITDPQLGHRLLDLIDSGLTAEEAMGSVTEGSPLIAYRQLAVVDARGNTAVWTGDHCLGTNATAIAHGAAAAGNLLASSAVPERMVASYRDASGQFGDRLLAALVAGLDAGGEAGPVHSAGMLIVDTVSWPTTDLRVDWSDDPVGDLSRLWRLWRPQIGAYLARALDPGSAPGYSVPE